MAGLAHPHTGQIRPIVFDHNLVRNRDDVVLVHLNHTPTSQFEQGEKVGDNLQGAIAVGDQGRKIGFDLSFHPGMEVGNGAVDRGKVEFEVIDRINPLVT